MFDFREAAVDFVVHLGLMIMVEGQGSVDLSQAQMNTRPGITWLRAMKFYSTGSLNSGKPFDENNQFINRYKQRRKTLEALKGLRI